MNHVVQWLWWLQKTEALQNPIPCICQQALPLQYCLSLGTWQASLHMGKGAFLSYCLQYGTQGKHCCIIVCGQHMFHGHFCCLHENCSMRPSCWVSFHCRTFSTVHTQRNFPVELCQPRIVSCGLANCSLHATAGKRDTSCNVLYPELHGHTKHHRCTIFKIFGDILNN